MSFDDLIARGKLRYFGRNLTVVDINGFRFEWDELKSRLASALKQLAEHDAAFIDAKRMQLELRIANQRNARLEEELRCARAQCEELRRIPTK